MCTHAEFFYRFEDLHQDASAAKIRRECPEGHRRYHAFKLFSDRYPDDVTYVHGILVSFMKSGLYSEGDFEYCYELAARGLSLANKKGVSLEAGEAQG